MMQRLNTVWFGAILALLAMVLGFTLGYLYFVSESSSSQAQSFFSAFLHRKEFQADMLILALVPNPFLFFLLLRKDLEKMALGVVITCLLAAIYIVALQTNVL